MKILLVYAHPEPQSLNGSIKKFLINHLENKGHHVQVSDLYSMNWKPTLDIDDYPDRPANTRFNPSLDSQYAFEHNTQREDIALEQDKLRWADTVIFQFPLWWFSMPAILKGWFDRVYAYGFAYGVGEHSDHHWGDRYGEGIMAGKRAMLLVTTGGWPSHYSPRGINGPIEDILFPIEHGILYYPGFDVLPPFVIYHTSKIDEEKFLTICDQLGERLDTLWQTPPIAFRSQNTGMYTIPDLTLRADIAPEQAGFNTHIVK
ncbi:NAD(P)H-dependent oxidoreductase [Neisseria sp. Ec49-e6-T10]|uniref:NAD(P)H-dependent oxidoreductase n=1 Tax=Neisseria sp. Ec49-e6-T10 TaxID=3140744 RepID=UPI003EBD061E